MNFMSLASVTFILPFLCVYLFVCCVSTVWKSVESGKNM